MDNRHTNKCIDDDDEAVRMYEACITARSVS